MAAIDRFQFLLEETLKYFSGIRDGFAVVGGFYAGKRTLGIAATFCNTIYIHICSRISIHTNLTQRFGPWAVVTGGSDGIGFAYCKELAKRGLNIVLISRSKDKLKKAATSLVVTGSSEGIGRAYARELARRGFNLVLISKPENRLYKAGKQIEEEFNVETCCVAVDFSVGRDTYSFIRESIQDKEIGVLVNNVGVMYDYPQLFLDVPEERVTHIHFNALQPVDYFGGSAADDFIKRLWQIVNINVAAATMMTHMILPQMVERGKGAVVMVSSGACSQITPLMTVYAGTKSFLDYFARALAYEYKNTGIVIQSLMPLYVNTKMTRYSNTLTSHSLMVPAAEIYAQQAVATLGYSARTTGYLPHTFLMWLGNLVPENMWMWAATRLNNALRRQALERLEKKPKVKSSDSMETMIDAKS